MQVVVSLLDPPVHAAPNGPHIAFVSEEGRTEDKIRQEAVEHDRAEHSRVGQGRAGQGRAG